MKDHSLHLIFCYFLLLCFSTAFSQNKVIDSLQKILSTSKNDSNRVNTLNALAHECSRNNPDTAIYLAHAAFQLATKLNYTAGLADAYLNTCEAEIYRANLDEA